ncbi:Aste57867_13989 [Aphanomyces stellatus]|uniref:Aste57867_13989 protein n=1 Tax=Aphanomyces stellatus TaxID=120398 RepID=A0A485KZK9_9STRA|nr:hypothetical protein As57867_013938 [Aphanomyces stellatus]VFT90819.1 Aste57867_13989 [Aphanomyces stellatus]
MAGRIVRLEQNVVDKIAAGEVVHRPASALKELLENSLDAGANQVMVVVGQGGMKLLQITDDGSGIRREDLDIVCERFTTSKLRKFEDLREIASYGFRGEALSSVSHVAHVTITSKTKDQPCAYRAHYRDGELVSKTPGGSKEPVPCAGKTGTQITVEDMFYNLNTRKQALKNFSEQYHRILDVMQRYALHYGGKGKSFVCKKHRENSCDLNIPHNASQLDVIKSIFGASLANEVIPYSLVSDDNVKATGFVTNANFNTKKSTFILFINNRLVECAALKRACEYIYGQYLPKHTHPFIYLALDIPPHHVDVNVHPTKREVHFLHEEAVVESITSHLNTLLQGGNQSRQFSVQPIATLMSSHIQTREMAATANVSDGEKDDSDSDTTPKKKKAKASPATPSMVQLNLSKVKAKTYQSSKAPQRLVRTDHTATTIDKYMISQSSSVEDDQLTQDAVDEIEDVRVEGVDLDSNDEEIDPKNLTSVVTLAHRVKSRSDRALTKIFREHTFVGVVNHKSSVIQHQTKLYLVDHTAVAQTLMYQNILHQFGSFQTIPLYEPMSIAELALCALDNPHNGYSEEDGPRDAFASEIQTLLVEKGPMLAEYFGLHITSEGLLKRIPQVIPGHEPSLHALPEFILQMNDINWDEEEACFDNVSVTLAKWYSDINYPDETNDNTRARQIVEHVIFPACKTTPFVAPHHLNEHGAVTPIACLNNLYKIFERC